MLNLPNGFNILAPFRLQSGFAAGYNPRSYSWPHTRSHCTRGIRGACGMHFHEIVPRHYPEPYAHSVGSFRLPGSTEIAFSYREAVSPAREFSQPANAPTNNAHFVTFFSLLLMRSKTLQKREILSVVVGIYGKWKEEEKGECVFSVRESSCGFSEQI